MHDVRFYDEQVGTPALANRQPLPSAIKTCVTDIPQPQHVAQQKESAVHQPRQITMSALQARDMLYNNFAQFTEISQNHYIAPEQSKQIIMDLTQFGPARFEPRIDRNNTLFLAVIWGQSEKYYKITYKEQR